MRQRPCAAGPRADPGRLAEVAIGHGGSNEAAVLLDISPHGAKPASFAAPHLTEAQAETAALLRVNGGILARMSRAMARRGTLDQPPPRPDGRSSTALQSAWRK